jgi:Glu-tRNA(Gln) amidotransferase subunit E-like FAD-binding protein
MNDGRLIPMNVKDIVLNAVSPSPLFLVELPKTKCRIIKQNGCKVYCGVYPLLGGLFRKDVGETRKFGRTMCDAVAGKMNNHGFFTTPEYGISYGLSEKEYEYIYEQTGASGDHHLVVMFAYPEREALETQTCFEELLRKEYLRFRFEDAGLAYSDTFLP